MAGSSALEEARYATPEGTRRYAARFAGRAPGHFRTPISAGELALSSLGIGTYLGEANPSTDRAYTEAIMAAVQGGINVIDTAINYRFQRSERSVGAALRALAAEGIGREEVLVCTKGGFLTPDGAMPRDAADYFYREFVETEILRAEDVAGGCHCISPAYLRDQLERSRRNLGLETIDVYFLHNPEMQLEEFGSETFRKRIHHAFAFLESAVAEGKIRMYGLATWNGFRQERGSKNLISLEEMVAIATVVGGQSHHFRFVQLPFNLAMAEAVVRMNQYVDGKPLAMVQAARGFGITVIASAALSQGQLMQGLPPFVKNALGLGSDRENALQFARSAPGVTTALVGMSRTEHVRENLALVGVEPARRDVFFQLFAPDTNRPES